MPHRPRGIQIFAETTHIDSRLPRAPRQGYSKPVTGIFIFKRLVAAAAALLLVLPSGCKKNSPQPEPSPTPNPAIPREAPPERVREKSPEALLQTLHHAAQEMALDGFQFDKPELGWPRDRDSQSASAHLQALANNGYISPEDLPLFAEIDIANLSDSNPGESAFAKIQTRGEALIIRKDGQITTAAATEETIWLPR